jgi:hypothetical protein
VALYLPEFGDKVVALAAASYTRSLSVVDVETGEYATLAGSPVAKLYADTGGDPIVTVSPMTGGGTTELSTGAQTLSLSVGRRYRWEYSGITIGGSPVGPFVEAFYVSRASLVPTFGEQVVIDAQPGLLSTKPAGQTTWWPQILLAREEWIGRLIAETSASRADLWDPGVWRNYLHPLAVSKCLDAVAGGAGGPIRELAAAYAGEAELAWRRLVPGAEYDTDGDRGIDAGPDNPTVGPSGQRAPQG